MYDDPEHNEYDDDDYKFYPQENHYQYDFKFEEWLKDALNDLIQDGENSWVVKPKKFPVSDDTSKGTSKEQFFMYLGSNHYSEAIWKNKYFVSDKLNVLYKNHISSNAAHFLKQPMYYKGLFDILN